MNNQIQIWINQVEEAWLKPLLNYAVELFRNTFLPSHDPTHHQRVWNISKELLSEISAINPQVDQALVEGVLIASLFHDLGMARSTRADHGKLGRMLCEKWFEKSDLPLPSLLGEILYSIEMHDNKDQEAYAPVQPHKRPEILTILSLADDLEAFGNIGIYRYSEIYLQRGISLNDLGTRVLNNAANRYGNLLKGCAICETALKKHLGRYTTLKLFFEHYNQQLVYEPHPQLVFAGHLGVINYIRTLGMKECIRPEALSDRIEERDTDIIAINYFKALKNELEQASI